MTRRLLLCAAALLLLPMAAFAQNEWEEVEAPVVLQHEGLFHSGPIVHGLVMDNNDRLWIANFGAGDGIVVLEEDGSHAPFSPIESLTIDGTEYPTVSALAGINLDHEGNIIFSMGGALYRVNPNTGEGIDRWAGPGGSLVRPAVDEFGFVYVSIVGGSSPVTVLQLPGFIQQMTFGDPEVEYNWWSRAHEVSPNGQRFISGRLGGGLVVYESEDLMQYTLTDTIGIGPDQTIFDHDVSSITWGPNGLLWATDEGAFATDPVESTRALKVFDFEERTYFTLRHDSLDINPRGIAFSEDGETVYVGSFGTGYTRKFSLVDPSGVSSEPSQLPTAFELEQNYPNPFNPSTTINFTMRETANVTLKVYNAAGQEVATLVKGTLPSGQHQAVWNGLDASGAAVSSGVYFYSLESNDHRMTKPMVLMK